MNDLVIIKEYTVGERGERNMIVSLPPVWLKQQDIKSGDTIEFLQAPNSSELIIRKAITQPSKQKVS